MRPSGEWLLAIVIGACIASPAAAVDYVAEIKPILSKHCYSCHGSLRQKSGLRLDHLTFLRAGGDRGAAIAPSGESLLIQAVTEGSDFERMPLDAKPLPDEEIAKLKQWIAEGAPAPDEPLPADPLKHWSYQKPVRPPLPTVSDPAWNSHPIDRLLAAEYQRHGLVASRAAAKHVLLRRVYLDLVGVPPTPGELRAFLADDSADAYQRVVDRLLASPQYGERWGRHWMDVWRYSDWDGFGAEVRESQPHIWRWRDWIIESLNADKPYDEMVREMLAADELAPGDERALRATGFLVRNWYKFNRNVWLEGIVEHTSKALLGVTLNCARCHDHMYDPILQTEYYQFRALFEPHDVRTDRVAGQSDTKLDGLVRVYDAKADAATHLFVRGNEAKPDKDHPLAPAVPKALGGGLSVAPVALGPSEYYPGLRDFVRREVLAKARADVDSAEAAMAKAGAALAEARKKLADHKPAAKDAPEAEAKASAAEADKLRAAIAELEPSAALAEQDVLAAAAAWVAVKAKIAADDAAFAAPPAADAKDLATEAARAERVANTQQARRDVLRLEQQFAKVKDSTDEAAKKQAKDLDTKLAAARKAHDEAAASLGTPGDNYTRFTPVYPAMSTGRRAALARWITSRDNPLAARVAINHIWLRHFAAPLVPTVFDFGLAGKPPVNPALLDWLAAELMDGGWRMKNIHRLIVTSSAYQLDSRSGDESNLARDRENVYLWRMNPRRMEAEVVRDSTLHVAGLLDTAMFGPETDQNLGLTLPRRSIYFRSSKEKKVAFLDTFDRANVTDCYRRSETVVPQQALALVNSSLSLSAARRLAAALSIECASQLAREGSSAFIAAAFERVLNRPPTAEESATCLEFLDVQSRRLADPQALVAFTPSDESAKKPAPLAQAPSTDPLARARENLVHVLLNHNDFVTVR